VCTTGKKRARVQPTEPIGHRFIDSVPETAARGRERRIDDVGWAAQLAIQAAAPLASAAAPQRQAAWRAKRPAAAGAAASTSASDSDEEVSGSDRAGKLADEDRTSMAVRPRKATRRAGRVGGRLPGAAEQAAAGLADAPRGGRHEAAWEGKLARLVGYKEAHGDCNVPRGWAEDPQLGRWVNMQREYKKALDRGDPSPGMTAGRAARLESLGFAWALSSEQISKRQQASATDEAAWEAQHTRLAAYKAAHGDCNVPQGWAEHPPLGKWVSKQREYKKALDRGDPRPKITAARAAKLEALGFAWVAVPKRDEEWTAPARPEKAARPAGQEAAAGEPSAGTEAVAAESADPLGSRGQDEGTWEAQLARLEAYKEAHGDCSVPKGWAEDPRLASWVHDQRTRKRKLDRGGPSEGMTAERAAQLMALGFVWEFAARGSAQEAAWEAQLARLVAYKAAHGDCNVPRRWPEDPRLSNWVHDQRKRKRRLDCGGPSAGRPAARATRLTALGFVWDLRDVVAQAAPVLAQEALPPAEAELAQLASALVVAPEAVAIGLRLTELGISWDLRHVAIAPAEEPTLSRVRAKWPPAALAVSSAAAASACLASACEHASDGPALMDPLSATAVAVAVEVEGLSAPSRGG
jgi:hypothetical protein